MVMKRNVLPPLDYLLAFEAAATSQSFVGASKALNISETAISRKVRLLEQHYKTPLFQRGTRSITLTGQGIALLDAIRPALAILRNASHDLLTQKAEEPVMLAATHSVASLWLMPRLQDFNAANKHLTIMLVASDSDAECLAETNELSILRGDGNWPGYKSHLLFGETIFPVCAPGYLAANPEVKNIQALPSLALIDVSSGHREWMNWTTWLTLNNIVGRSREKATIFNTYPLSIQAAVEGLGVALGWGHLVDHLLEQGKLVRPLGDVNIRTDHGYHLLRRENEPQRPECAVVQGWLLQISASRTRYRIHTAE